MHSEKNYLVSVIIPVYNEERTIEEIISRVYNVSINKEIIVVNDGSRDRTSTIISNIKDKYNLKIINLEKNFGKGYAIRRGIEASSGEIILTQDADLETDPAEYQKLLAPIIEGRAKVVFGSRFLGTINNMNKFNYIGNKFLTFIANVLYRIKITDEATAYKIFLKEVLDGIKLKSNHFELCPELVAKIAKRKYEIFEIPISFNGRSKNEGKKLRLRDGIAAIWTLIKYRFTD
jgi:glycosyltransferase involved in cell wall biosynthesis